MSLQTENLLVSRIENWLNELKTYSTNHDLIKMLVGNKCDMLDKRVVKKEEGMKCALKHHMMFIETSAIFDLGFRLSNGSH